MSGKSVLLLLWPLLLAGCEETIEKYNPAEPKVGTMQYSTPQADPPTNLSRARSVRLLLRVDEHLESNDHIILVNQSDGAIYGLAITVNNDYLYTVPLIQMGETVRIPETWLATKLGQPFPSERRVRMERVEVRFNGKLAAFYDARGNPAPAE